MTVIDAFSHIEKLIAQRAMKMEERTDLYPFYEDLHKVTDAIVHSESLEEKVGHSWKLFLKSLHGQPILRKIDHTYVLLNTKAERRYLKTREWDTTLTWKRVDPKDIPSFIKVAQAVATLTHEGLIQMRREMLPFQIGSPIHQCLYAEDKNGQIVAFAILKDLNASLDGRSIKTRHLNFLARRASAVGMKVFASMAEQLKGLPHLYGDAPQAYTLHVLADNERAIHLYEKHLGMSVVERISNFYPDGRDGVLMASNASITEESLRRLEPHEERDLYTYYNSKVQAYLSEDPITKKSELRQLKSGWEPLPVATSKTPDHLAFQAVKLAVYEANEGLSTATAMA